MSKREYVHRNVKYDSNYNMVILAPLKGFNSLTWDHNIHKYGRVIHEHHNHALSLSLTTVEGETTIVRELCTQYLMVLDV